MKFIKRLFCRHEWYDSEYEGWYRDYMGFVVEKWSKECRKCGKKKRYKTW